MYLGNDDGSVYAISSYGNLNWRTELGSRVSSPVLDSAGTMFLASQDGKLYALSSVSGKMLWSFKTGYLRSKVLGLGSITTYSLIHSNILYVGLILQGKPLATHALQHWTAEAYCTSDRLTAFFTPSEHPLCNAQQGLMSLSPTVRPV